MASLKTISLALAGFSLSAAAQAQTTSVYSPNQVGMAMMRLNASLLDHDKKTPAKSGSVWAKMRKEFRMGEVNPELVRQHESRFSSGPDYFTRTIERSKPYMSYIAGEVEKRNMPAEIALLPFIESAYVSKARSRVGASGLWQFMPATGRRYGLEQTSLYDGRHDVEAATDAALNYLQYLYGLFGDWSLALAAYNWGEGNVSRAVNRAQAQGLDPVYENLRMPNETRNYVPKLMAVRNIVRDPQYYGISLSEIDSKPYFKAVTLDRPIDVSAAARLADISESEFLALNPAFKAPVFVPSAKRKMLLPVSAVGKFEKNYQKADKASLLSWDVYQTQGYTDLASIAAETGTSLSELKRLNGLNGAYVESGYNLLVAKNGGDRQYAASDFARIGRDANSGGSKAQAVEPVRPGPAANALAAAQPLQPKAIPVETAPAQTASAKPDGAAPPAGNPVSASSYVAIAKLPAAAPSTDTARAKALPLPLEPEAKPQNTGAYAAANPVRISPPATEQAARTEAPSSKPAAHIAQTRPDLAATATPPLASDADRPQADAEGLQPDDIQLLVQQNSAAESVRNTLSRLDEEEIRANQARLAKARQQERTQERLARARQAGTHQVTDGDTMYNIAQRYNISVADLATINNIRGSNIRKGQILKVAAANGAQSGNLRSVSYTVRKGDTLNTIASRFNLDINDIRRWNKNTRTVTPGQRINLMGS